VDPGRDTKLSGPTGTEVAVLSRLVVIGAKAGSVQKPSTYCRNALPVETQREAVAARSSIVVRIRCVVTIFVETDAAKVPAVSIIGDPTFCVQDSVMSYPIKQGGTVIRSRACEPNKRQKVTASDAR
jgi:hypothetical protein